MRRCKIDGCDKKHEARGWCNAHYRRWSVHGDPEGGLYSPHGASFSEKADRFIEKTDSCWLWTGGTTNQGYGQVHINRVKLLAHRLSYEAFVGPIPEGLEIDHLCRNTSCVNPDHLEPVTRAENLRRRDAALGGEGGTGDAWACPHGVPWVHAHCCLPERSES